MGIHMKEEKQRALLSFKHGGYGWSGPPDPIWEKILKFYLFEIADCFGIRSITSLEMLRLRTVFNFVDMTQFEMLRVKKYKPERIGLDRDPKTYVEDLALFELNATAQRALAFAPYAQLTIQDEFFERDEISFFAGASQLAVTVDSDIIFYNLNREYYALLCAADPSIAQNLWTDYGMTAIYTPRS